MWNKIEKRLKEMDKSIYWLAKEAGVTRQAVYRLQQGAKGMTLDTAFKLADALQMDVNEFRKEKRRGDD